jgi:hypothetical protein
VALIYVALKLDVSRRAEGVSVLQSPSRLPFPSLERGARARADRSGEPLSERN